jgi:hypothetical protein
MNRPILRAPAAAVLALLATLSTATPTRAQSSAWIALDARPAGTPAGVVFNADASSPSTSVLDVSIHGFWVVQKTGADGRIYQSIEVPGLPNKAQQGAPNLPVCRFDLGLTTGAEAATMQPPIVTASAALPGYLVWPEPIEAMLHDGSPEVFVRDEAIYSTPGFWPASDGPSPVPMHTLLGFLPTASCEAYPFHWDPLTGLLSVATNVRYSFVHGGPGLAPPPTTPAQRKVVSHLIANWQSVGSSVVVDTRTYAGYYLIICPQAYQQTLQPLADQKSARGLKVTERFVEDIGAACQSIRNAIGTWYNGTPKGAEHYCLLVGDVDEIPICSGPGSLETPFGDPSDDPYGAPFLLNNDRQVMVGRLSPISPSELDWDIGMILAYEDHPVQDNHYGDVLLVAHGGVIGASDDIWPYQEKIRTAAYASPPSFYTLYGNVVGVDNNSLKAAIQGGRGLVDYLGHGFSGGWGCWDLSCQNFTGFEVGVLSLAPRNPIVWSIACQSNAIPVSECFGESFMQRYGLGALAFYGSTVNAHAYPSIELNQNLFFAVYSQDIRKQGYTYFDAEYRMENTKHSGDSWKYLLLGDPEMTIRTTQPESPWTVSAPWVERSACGPSGCPEIRMLVTLASGAPAAGVRVGVWQPASSPAGSARAGAAGSGAAATAGAGVQDARYTDGTGLAAVPAPGLGDGPLYFTVVDEAGNALPDTAVIVNGQVTGVGAQGANGILSLGAMPSVVRAGTVFTLGRPARGPARLDLYDATGRRVRSLAVAHGEVRVSWDVDDASGRRVAPGIYLASIRDAQGRASARVVVLR